VYEEKKIKRGKETEERRQKKRKEENDHVAHCPHHRSLPMHQDEIETWFAPISFRYAVQV
jgi:hypothetical protein